MVSQARQLKKLIVAAVLIALVSALAGNATAQIPQTIATIQASPTGLPYTTDAVITQILSQPGAVNGIGGTGSSVVYTYAFYVNDGTGGLDIYGNLPAGSSYVPTVGDMVQVTGDYDPYHQIPEMDNITSISKISANNPLPASSSITTTIPYVANDIALNSIQISGGTATVLPNDIGGVMVTLDNVKISGAGAPGATFGTTNSPSPGAIVIDPYTTQTPNSMVFYYWPTSYSIANANLANMKIPTGLVDMTGFISVYGNSNVPEFSPITITPTLGPPTFWQPASGSSIWDGTTLSWSASSGQRISLTGDVSSSNATFDDTGLATGGTVNVVGAQNALSLTVSNTGGTYTFTGGTITAEQLSKTGAGTLLVNSTLLAPVSVTAGTLGGNGSIGPLTVGSGATVTPGATVSTIGQLTINGNADFSAGGTYLWKLGSSLVDNSSGTAGTSWDLLNLNEGGYVNFGGSSQLSLQFSGTANPTDGSSFWDSNHIWVIASSGVSAPVVGGNIINGSYPGVGTFSLQGDTAGDLQLKFTSVDEQPRNLFWSANGTAVPVDGKGTWSNTGNAKWTDLSTAGLTFDSSRPDNVTFGNTSGTGGAATVTVSGAVTAGSLTFNGGNSAQYTLSGGTLTVNDGVSAAQSANLVNNEIVLGYSQTWSVASGTLSAVATKGIAQATLSSLTVAGPGTLALYCQGKYTGGTTLSNSGVISTQGNYYLPQSGVVTTAAGTQLLLNGFSQTVGALSGSGSIDLGSGGCTLTFGDTSSQTFSGAIIGKNASLIYAGAGTSSLAGTNTFTGAVSINGGGELQVSADANLGNAANGVTIDNASLLGATASFATNRAITVGPFNGTLDVVGSATVLTVNGPVTGGGTLSVNNPNPSPNAPAPGTLVLTNSNNSYAATVLSNGTLSVSSSGDLGSGPIQFLGLSDGSTLQFTSPMTLSNDLYFPVIGKKAIWFDSQGNNVTLTGQLWPASSEYYSVAMYKIGSGTLNLAAGDTTNDTATKGNWYVNQGVLELSGSISNHYSAVGQGDIQVSAGAVLQLANVQLGYQNDETFNASPLGYLQLNSGTGSITNGATLSASGTSSYTNGNIEVALNYNGNNTINNKGSAAPYAPGNVYIQTFNAGDVLSIQNSVKQYDRGATDINNNNGNAVWSSSAARYVSDPSKLVVIHVMGPGVVQLQSGGVSSDTTFGGEWSVDSGVLQVGPYQPSFYNSSADYWSGPAGQLLNALGFKTVDGQTYNGSGSVQGDPDIPNGVTVHSGGMFAVAVDQVNTNASLQYSESTANPTPDYLRNPITLSGGTLAATGYEMVFNTTSFPNDPFGLAGGSMSTTPVTAKLGGDFTVSPGTSTIATYDPLGNTGARTVQLLGGSRTLSNSTAAFAAGTVLTYNTIWNGTLNVDGGTAQGGQFDLWRDAGGTVSVGTGASINILNGATVNVGGTEPNAALYDSGSGNSVNFVGGAGGGHLVFSRSADLTYRGNISGDLDLSQEGSGMLVLSGSNNYSGGTIVSSGTLMVASASALPTGSSLVIGAGGSSIFDSLAAKSSFAGSPSAVPEPDSLTLLLTLAGCAAGISLWQRAKRVC
ncbi:MAG: beta strand repeat-containing protein [Thermoguttaceae bacterium]